ncbi:MAG: hydrogen gas-evolving membrane-bound hydrogenase subunit E [Paracoccaceae bacterium]
MPDDKTRGPETTAPAADTPRRALDVAKAVVAAPPRDAWRFLPAAISGIAFLWFLTYLPSVAHGETYVYARPWIEPLGIELAFLIDGLGLVFALLVTGIGALVFLYAAGYFEGDPRSPRILSLLFLFAVAMLGLVLADDVVTLFVFWEGTTITSFLLVGFDYEKAYARRAALQALLGTGLGGRALLGGLVVLGDAMGSYRLSELNTMGEAITASALYTPILALVLLGAFTKSAQFPFHFWLPGAMAAPTPVSAYLHSATMVKAGVYLLMRMAPALGDTAAWFWLLTLFGATTMLIGSVWALRQSDLKQMLAHTTVMGLGTIVMFLGGGTEEAVMGATTFLVVHALYKASLFLMIGCVDKKAGTREVDRLAGLRSAMPITAAMAVLAALSMAGLPPFIGYVGKEAMYEGALHVVTEPMLVTAAAFVANAMMVAVALIVTVGPFFRGAQACPKTPKDPSWMMWSGPMALAVLGLLAGLAAPVTGHYLAAPVASSILGHHVESHLALWHGLSPLLVLSLATWGLGVLFWLGNRAIRTGLASAEAGGLVSADRSYDYALRYVDAVARGVTGYVQTGVLEWYMRATFAALALVVWAAVGLTDDSRAAPDFDLPLVDYATFAVILVSVAVVVLTRSRLTAICALGAVGVGVSIIFVLYGAVDVAMTQLMIEILIVVFLAIALIRLPRVPDRQGFRVGDAASASAVGRGVTTVLISVVGEPIDLELTRFFEQNSYPVAHGQNIVNVILVDFRALDTLGEISVIVIASLGAVAALTAGKGVTLSGGARETADQARREGVQ